MKGNASNMLNLSKGKLKNSTRLSQYKQGIAVLHKIVSWGVVVLILRWLRQCYHDAASLSSISYGVVSLNLWPTGTRTDIFLWFTVSEEKLIQPPNLRVQEFAMFMRQAKKSVIVILGWWMAGLCLVWYAPCPHKWAEWRSPFWEACAAGYPREGRWSPS